MSSARSGISLFSFCASPRKAQRPIVGRTKDSACMPKTGNKGRRADGGRLIGNARDTPGIYKTTLSLLISPPILGERRHQLADTPPKRGCCGGPCIFCALFTMTPRRSERLTVGEADLQEAVGTVHASLSTKLQLAVALMLLSSWVL